MEVIIYFYFYFYLFYFILNYKIGIQGSKGIFHFVVLNLSHSFSFSFTFSFFITQHFFLSLFIEFNRVVLN